MMTLQKTIETIKKMAKLHDEYSSFYVSFYLWLEELERLRDENARLRSCISDDIENAKLITGENHDLREYAAYLLDFIDPAAHQSGCNRTCPAYKTCEGTPFCTFVSWATQKARELGVERDD